MYPQTAAEVTALIVAVSPIILWALSSLLNAITAIGRSNREHWERLHHLVRIVYNKNGESGELGQLVAIREMRARWFGKNAIRRVAEVARRDFARQTPNGAVVAELDDLLKKLG